VKRREAVLLLVLAVSLGLAWIAVGFVLAGLAAFPLDEGSGRPEASSWIVAYAPFAGTVLLLGSAVGFSGGHTVGGRRSLIAAGLCFLLWLAATIVLEV
jgi:hypothetical protein